MLDRVRGDCLKLVNALGYDFDTLEFAVRDGVPYAIDFLNPAPDADVHSVGAANFEWVLEHASKWLIERVHAGPEAVQDYRWQWFLAGGNGRPADAPAAGKPRRLPPRPKAPSPRTRPRE
jgi:hypothetical protein